MTDLVDGGSVTPVDGHDVWPSFHENAHGRLLDSVAAAESDLASRIAHLEHRLEAAGYFGNEDGGAPSSHPLAKRVDELESRLSLDVVTHAVSRRVRRTLIIGTALLCAIGVVLTTIIGMQISQLRTDMEQYHANARVMETEIGQLTQEGTQDDRDIRQLLARPSAPVAP